MKKLILCILISIMCTFLASCGTTVQKVEELNTTDVSMSMFVEVEATSKWTIVYHRDTRVMYAVSAGYYNCGTFTLLVNADGTPMIYEG